MGNDNMDVNTNDSAEKKKKDKMKGFRIQVEDLERYEKIFRENGLKSDGEAFSFLLRAAEMVNASGKMPERDADIKEARRVVGEIENIIINSYERYYTAGDTIREEFRVKIEMQDHTIADLQDKKKELEESLKLANQTAEQANVARIEAENTAKTADQLRASAEQTAADKQTIADTLAAKLAEAESKLTEYDKLKAEMAADKEQIRVLEQQLKDKDRDATEAAKEAERSLKDAVAAEREKAQVEREALKDQIRQVEKDAEAAKEVLRDQLRTAKSEAEAAKKDAETAKATALAEVSEKHQAEIAKLQARIGELTDQLIADKKAGK